MDEVRRAAKVDQNQPEIVTALRAVGATVTPLHAVGSGCPDLLCGYAGKNVLIEIKDGAKPPSARRLTKDQKRWHATWAGQVVVVKSIDEALTALGIEHRGIVE